MAQQKVRSLYTFRCHGCSPVEPKYRCENVDHQLTATCRSRKKLRVECHEHSIERAWLHNLRLRAEFHQPTKLTSSATTPLTCRRAVVCVGAPASPSRAYERAHSRLVRTVKAACQESKLPEIEVTARVVVFSIMPRRFILCPISGVSNR